jgi:N6-adenosine-specific RNA methylase IME4
MTIAELCELPVKEMVDDDAVLFLWVTSPLLFECEPIIKAWGFKYKTSFVWDKIKHNMGHYNSVRHEFLLICTRGSCTPDAKQLFDSVQSIERTQHSAKPEEFREIINTLYPHGKKLEMFARKEAPEGWETWGNQA